MERAIVLVGLSHHTAPVEVRERVAFGNGLLEPSLRRLVALEGVSEGAILSTCNRVEVIASGPAPEVMAATLPGFLAREHGLPEATLVRHLYTHAGREACGISSASRRAGLDGRGGTADTRPAEGAICGRGGRWCLGQVLPAASTNRSRSRSGSGARPPSPRRRSPSPRLAVELARSIFDPLAENTALPWCRHDG